MDPADAAPDIRAMETTVETIWSVLGIVAGIS